MAESEERCGAAQSRCDSLEETKSRLQGDVENLSADLETSNHRESQLDKKQRQFDKALSDAKSKQEDAQIALEAAIKETRMAEVESAKLKEDLEDTTDGYDKVMKKNKKLHEEINDLQHTVQESSRNIHELEKEKRSGWFQNDTSNASPD